MATPTPRGAGRRSTFASLKFGGSLAALIPTHVIGDTAVVGPLDDDVHQAELLLGVRAVGDATVPVVVHLDGDAVERCKLRLALQGQNVPDVAALVVDDGGRQRGFIERHAGDVSLRALMEAGAAASLPFGVAIAIARAIANPLARLDAGFAIARRAARSSRGWVMPPEPALPFALPNRVFVGANGVVRSLIEPRPVDREEETADPGDLRRAHPLLDWEARYGATTTFFSFGLVLFELVTGSHPFARPGLSSMDLLTANEQEPVPSLLSRRTGVPAVLVDVIERLLRRQRGEAFPSWSGVVAALDEAARRVERASANDVAAFARALVPDAFERAVAREEEAALVDLTRLNLRAWVGVHERPLPYAAREEDDWGDTTPPSLDTPFLGRDGRGLWRLPDRTTLIDAAPVSHGAWAAFAAATKRPPLAVWQGDTPPPELVELAVTGVSYDDAAAYCAHFQCALPTDEQWQEALNDLGSARLSTGAIWEWTSTLRGGRRVVRGGRSRATDDPGDGDGTFVVDDGEPADDIGFRCVTSSGRLLPKDSWHSPF